MAGICSWPFVVHVVGRFVLLIRQGGAAGRYFGPSPVGVVVVDL